MVVDRYKFYRRDQRPGEGISDFVVELKRMAATCNFGTFLEEAIRDRFIVADSSDNTTTPSAASFSRRKTTTSPSKKPTAPRCGWKQRKHRSGKCAATAQQAAPVPWETSAGNESLHHQVKRTFRLQGLMLRVLGAVVHMAEKSVRI